MHNQFDASHYSWVRRMCKQPSVGILETSCPEIFATFWENKPRQSSLLLLRAFSSQSAISLKLHSTVFYALFKKTFL